MGSYRVRHDWSDLAAAAAALSSGVSCSAMSYSLRPHGLWPARLLSPWDFPGKNTVGDCHFLLLRIFLTQGLNPGLHIASSLLIAWATIIFTIVKRKLQRSINNWNLVIKDLWVWIFALLRPEQGCEVDRISVSFYVKYKWWYWPYWVLMRFQVINTIMCWHVLSAQ